MLLFQISVPDWASRPATSFVVAALASGLLLLFLLLRRDWLLTLLARGIGRFAPAFQTTVLSRLTTALSSLAVLQNGRDNVALTLWSGLIWGTAFLTNYLVLQALHISVHPISALLVLLVLQVGISLPSAPATIGLFEYLCVVTLTFFQVDATEALGFGILLHLIVFLPTTLAGLLLFWATGLSLSQLEPAAMQQQNRN